VRISAVRRDVSDVIADIKAPQAFDVVAIGCAQEPTLVIQSSVVYTGRGDCSEVAMVFIYMYKS
jgi:hypothetical protein